MKLFPFRFLFTLLFGVGSNLISTIPAFALQDPVYYSVTMKDKEIGWGLIAAQREGSDTCVDYRLSVNVKKLGINVYSTYRFQRALFDSKGRLLRAVSQGKVKGQVYDVKFEKDKNGYTVTKNGQKSHVAQIAMTTLTPVITSTLQSGDWLDVTTGSIVPYKVQNVKSKITLVHDGGQETLTRQNGIIDLFTSGTSDSPVLIKRSSTAVPQDESHENPVSMLQGCQ